ncbi:hypothetical protein EV361DRAFT_955971 [Lentinula raphanica]|nr:hypothetical protein EV361DRAFT_955971 [Lentinula raphanica]
MRSVKTWQGENMYPNQDRPDLGGNPPPHSGYASSRSGGGADFFERLQRETMTVNIWPPSPKPPARDLYVSASLTEAFPPNEAAKSPNGKA